MKLEGDIHSGIAYRSAVDVERAARARAAQPNAAAGRGRGPSVAVPTDPRWTLYGPGFDYDYDRLMAVTSKIAAAIDAKWRGAAALSGRNQASVHGSSVRSETPTR